MIAFANANGSRLKYDRAMRHYVGLLALLVVAGLLTAACGSGGAADERDIEPLSRETPRSERAERQATIMQQQELQQEELQQAELQRAELQEAQAAAESEQVDVQSDEAPDQVVTEYGEIDFGHRKGLPFLRNVVGDPDAPVVIVEYSDFQ